MSIYTVQRDEIKTQLLAVSGIGKVYTKRPNTNDESKFKSDYSSNGKINAAFITRVDGQDNINSNNASQDETDEILITEKSDYWNITLLYGYNDTDPSEDTFQGLVDVIEDKFRFLQDLNAKAFFSYPLQRTTSGLFTMFGDVLCHKAEFRLQVVSRIINQ